MKLFLILTLFLASCNNYKIKEFNLYTQTVLDKVNPYPTPEELKERIKIAVVIDDQTNVNVVNFNQKQIAMASLFELLQGFKNVDILDRGIIKNIKEEAMLSEIKSGKSMAENKDADFVFLIKMDGLIFSSAYDARNAAKIGYSIAKIGAILGTEIFAGGGGIFIDAGSNPISGQYNYTSTFSGAISVIQLPGGEVVAKIPLSATSQSNESAPEIGSIVKEVDPKLMEQAIKEAINNTMPQISKTIPATGHIMQRSDYKPEEPALFKVTFGESNGVQIGDSVFLQRKIYETNLLNNEQEISIKKIPLGVVIENDFGDHFCWIRVDNKVLASTIKIAEKVAVNLRPNRDKKNGDND